MSSVELINRIAATIRRVDGNHTKGAGALAEAIVADLFRHTPEVEQAVRDRIRTDALDRFAAEYFTPDARNWLAGFSARAALEALGYEKDED